MITKGTAEYKAAQNIAYRIHVHADENTWSDRGVASESYLESLLEAISIKTELFASQVAKTVIATLGKGRQVARVSDKQAWILACATIENNIDWNAVHEARIELLRAKYADEE